MRCRATAVMIDARWDARSRQRGSAVVSRRSRVTQRSASRLAASHGTQWRSTPARIDRAPLRVSSPSACEAQKRVGTPRFPSVNADPRARFRGCGTRCEAFRSTWPTSAPDGTIARLATAAYASATRPRSLAQQSVCFRLPLTGAETCSQWACRCLRCSAACRACSIVKAKSGSSCSASIVRWRVDQLSSRPQSFATGLASLAVQLADHALSCRQSSMRFDSCTPNARRRRFCTSCRLARLCRRFRPSASTLRL